MRQVTAQEANQHFAKVLCAVEGGEAAVISKRGKPVAVMSPYQRVQDEEREAAVAEFLKLLDQPPIPEGIRTYSRDEMHERP
jgi:prevent-host-death family protein